MTVDDTVQWFVARDGKQTGPISDAEVKAIAMHGYFRATDLVWRPGFAEWRPALDVFPPSVADVFPPSVATAPEEPAIAEPEPEPEPIALQVVEPLPEPEPEPAYTPAFVAPEPVHEPVPAPANYTYDAPVATPAPAFAPLTHTLAPEPEALAPAAPAPLERQPEPEPLRRPIPAPAAPAPMAATAASPATAPVRPFEPAAVPAPQAFRPQSADPASRLPATPPYRGEPYRPGPAPAAGFGQPQPAPAPRPQFQAPEAGPATATAAMYAPLPGPMAAEPRRPLSNIEDEDEQEETTAPPRKRGWFGLAAVLVVLAALIAGGIYVANDPAMEGRIAQVKALLLSSGSPERATADLDARWQKTAHWPVIKREFPDWYGERLREAAQLARDNKSDEEINKTLVDQLIVLRRQNAALALAASTTRLKALASAFLDNLRQLKLQSTTACYSFISQGEATPAVIDQFQVHSKPTPLQMQVAAIFEAIGEGRKSPVTHEKPIKADYDSLMEQLAKLGWSQTDVATFADPRALARAEPGRVCQMVQDWFVAHISIPDESAQERLLGETLRPVVAG